MYVYMTKIISISDEAYEELSRLKNQMSFTQIILALSKMSKKESQKRAKEATQGVVESIKWLEDVNAVIVVLDASKNPYTQVNITIIGNLVARKIPVLIVANKIDLRKADIKKVEAAFPEYDVVGISAKKGKNMEEFYESVFKLAKKI